MEQVTRRPYGKEYTLEVIKVGHVAFGVRTELAPAFLIRVVTMLESITCMFFGGHSRGSQCEVGDGV